MATILATRGASWVEGWTLWSSNGKPVSKFDDLLRGAVDAAETLLLLADAVDRDTHYVCVDGIHVGPKHTGLFRTVEEAVEFALNSLSDLRGGMIELQQYLNNDVVEERLLKANDRPATIGRAAHAGSFAHATYTSARSRLRAALLTQGYFHNETWYDDLNGELPELNFEAIRKDPADLFTGLWYVEQGVSIDLDLAFLQLHKEYQRATGRVWSYDRGSGIRPGPEVRRVIDLLKRRTVDQVCEATGRHSERRAADQIEMAARPVRSEFLTPISCQPCQQTCALLQVVL